MAWASYDLVLVRSTWDYALRREEFLAWAARCRRTANPQPVLRWSTDKRYLTDLSAAGVPVVPTDFVAPGQPLAAPDGWQEIVVKPTISVSAADTGRYPAGHADAHDLVRRLHRQGRDVMVQPYLAAIDSDGETALVYLGGHFSHAVRKAALLTGHGERPPVVGDDALAHTTATTASAAQLAVGEQALRAVPGAPDALTYARVDLVPDLNGAPLLLELELAEPSLFLRQAPPPALRRLAEHTAAASVATQDPPT